MEENTKPKKVNRIALAVFFVALMFLNLWIANKMAAAPFHSFVIMVFLVNVVLALGFRTVYNTIMRDDSKKNDK